MFLTLSFAISLDQSQRKKKTPQLTLSKFFFTAAAEVKRYQQWKEITCKVKSTKQLHCVIVHLTRVWGLHLPSFLWEPPAQRTCPEQLKRVQWSLLRCKPNLFLTSSSSFYFWTFDNCILPMGFSSWRIWGCFPWGKPTVTESCCPT